jgi:hypothetical protein
MRPKYIHVRCPVCRCNQDFKLLPNERDEFKRTLMVCARCNAKRAAPGQVKPSWREMMGRD